MAASLKYNPMVTMGIDITMDIRIILTITTTTTVIRTRTSIIDIERARVEKRAEVRVWPPANAFWGKCARTLAAWLTKGSLFCPYLCIFLEHEIPSHRHL